jgi:hypothetical protein
MRWRPAVLALVLSCGRLDFDPIGGGTVPACSSYGPWGNLVHLAGATTDHETGPWLSPEGLDLWFARTSQSTLQCSLLRVTRASTADAFDLSNAVVAPFLPDPGTPDQRTTVFLTDDQLQIYYIHYQSTSNVYAAYRATTADPFANVTSLALNQNGTINDGDPALTADALTLLYDQWDVGMVDTRVFVTSRARTGDDFTAGTMLAGLSGNINGVSPNDDGSQLFYGLWPSGSHSAVVWSTRIDTTTYSAPTVVENQPAATDNMHPQLSRDGLTLMFSGDAGDGNGYDIYQLTRSCM